MSTVIDDNCCMCHMAALKTMTHAKNDDFIYVSFYNRVFETPFFVVADHETGSIVITIRGTISQRDVLTDLSAECEVIQWIDSQETLCAHRGMHNVYLQTFFIIIIFFSELQLKGKVDRMIYFI